MKDKSSKTQAALKEDYFKGKSTVDLEKELYVLLRMDNNGGMLADDIIEELGKRMDAKEPSFIKTAKAFLEDCRNLDVEVSSYSISYPEFLKYFAELDAIATHNLIIGINFAYGWMPTIFSFGSDNFDEAVQILNRARMGTIPTAQELQVLKNLFNGSLVGTSKLLHFISPTTFAIWDSRVYRYLTGKPAYNYRIGDCELYLKYLAFCNYITRLQEYQPVHNMICEKMGYAMTTMRTVELAMYLKGDDPKEVSM